MTMFLMFLNLISYVAIAQNIEVTGNVKDNQGIPIPGATIVLKSENIGVTFIFTQGVAASVWDITHKPYFHKKDSL